MTLVSHVLRSLTLCRAPTPDLPDFSGDICWIRYRVGNLYRYSLPLTCRLCALSSRGIRSDALLVPPIRQTASIFKQPITLVKNFPDGKVKTDYKPGQQEKPKQVSGYSPWVAGKSDGGVTVADSELRGWNVSYS